MAASITVTIYLENISVRVILDLHSIKTTKLVQVSYLLIYLVDIQVLIWCFFLYLYLLPRSFVQSFWTTLL